MTDDLDARLIRHDFRARYVPLQSPRAWGSPPDHRVQSTQGFSMIRRIWLAVALASLCFTVSAKPAPLPVPLAQDLPVEVVFNQHELAVVVPDTAAAVGM